MGIFKRALLTGFLVSIWLIGGFTLLSLILISVPHMILRTLTGVLGLVILFTGIYYAMRSGRCRAPGYSYLQALKTGVFISVVTGIMLAIASALYTYLNPHFADDMVKEAETSLRSAGTSAEVISSKLQAVRDEFTIGRQVVQALAVQILFGTVYSLILSAFMKSNKKR